jgi:hypothetical protein
MISTQKMEVIIPTFPCFEKVSIFFSFSLAAMSFELRASRFLGSLVFIFNYRFYEEESKTDKGN